MNEAYFSPIGSFLPLTLENSDEKRDCKLSEVCSVNDRDNTLYIFVYSFFTVTITSIQSRLVTSMKNDSA